MKKLFDIYGMTCSSCSSHVDKAVRSLKRNKKSKCKFTFK